MTKLAILAISLLMFSCALRTNPLDSYKTELLNGGFESVYEGLPPHWYFSDVRGFSYSLDSLNARQGKYSLKFSGTAAKDSNSYLQTANFLPVPKNSLNLRIVAEVKSKNIKDGHAGLWAKINKIDGTYILDNMEDREIKGTAGWKEHYITLPLDSATGHVTFGGFLSGTGEAWFDNFRIYVDNVLYEERYYAQFLPVTTAEVRELNQSIHQIKHTNPTEDYRDLMFLKDIVKDKRIIALGEATHGTAEFFQVKDRIIRYLVKELGFNVFSIEANMPEAYEVNSYLNGRDAVVSANWNGLGFWVWKTREINDMVEWMKSHNQASISRRIIFTGFDSQFPLQAIKTVEKYANKYNKALSLDLAKLEKLCTALDKEIRSHTVPMDKAQEITQLSELIYERLGESLVRHSGLLGKQELEWILQNGRLLVQIAGLNLSKQPYTYRDSVLAENISWILRSNPTSKVIIWSHNEHVKKSEKAMGTRLSNMFGDDYYAIGLTTQEGTYTAKRNNGLISRDNILIPGAFDSYEYFLSHGKYDNYFLDLTKVKDTGRLKRLKREHQFRLIGSGAIYEQFYLENLYQSFDGLIFLEKTSASDVKN